MLLLDRLFPRKRLPDELPWDLMIDARTCFTKCGGLLQVAHVLPPDLEASSPGSIDTHHRQLAALEGRLDEGWTIHHDQWRWLLDANLPKRQSGILAAHLVDEAERRQFTDKRAFDNSVFIALHFEPDNARAGLFEWVTSDDDAFSRSAMVRRFQEDAEKFFTELQLIMRKVTMLEGDALFSYLSQCVNYEPWPAAMPYPAICLSERLGSSTWRSGIRPQINRNHLRTIELYSLGALTADTVRMIYALPFELRWVTRADTTAKHQQAKWLKRMRAEYEQRRQSVARRMIQHFTRREEPDTNPAAVQQILEVDQLQADITLGNQGFAPISMNVHVWDEDPERVEEKALRVETELKNRGFRAEKARISAVLALLQDMPGADPAPREVPALFEQLVRVSPVTGVSRGEPMDDKWDGPALMLGYSERGVPVRIALHGPGQDNGNLGIIGRSGGGKSALMAKIAAATVQKYAGSRVIVFDIGRAFLPTCLCLGGDWFELGQGKANVQILRHIDDPDQFRTAHDALWRMLDFLGVERTHEHDHALVTGMRLLARPEFPIEKRTFTQLVKRIGASIAVRDALDTFTVDGGAYGETFDGVVDSYGSARVIGVECAALRKSEILPFVVSAVFDALRYERLRDGAPSLVMFDEFHELLKLQTFRDEADRIAREIRKHNGVMVFATQNPADMTEELAAVIDAQCPNRILTPNPNVREPNQARFYRALGYTDDEMQQVELGYEKAEYFMRLGDNFRGKAQVRLMDEAAAICGRTQPRDIQQCFQLLAQGVHPGEAFTRAWLEYTGTPITAEKAA